jgi:hypothetical protein
MVSQCLYNVAPHNQASTPLLRRAKGTTLVGFERWQASSPLRRNRRVPPGEVHPLPARDSGERNTVATDRKSRVAALAPGRAADRADPAVRSVMAPAGCPGPPGASPGGRRWPPKAVVPAYVWPLDSPPSPSAGLGLGLRAVVAATEVAFWGSFCRCGILASRAYSSIGQSPRLITGPFLVRTQVGPPASHRREWRGDRVLGVRNRQLTRLIARRGVWRPAPAGPFASSLSTKRRLDV